MIKIENWGLIDYATAIVRQQELFRSVAVGMEDVLVLCEHPAVITLGRQSHDENILMGRFDLEARGIPVIRVNRGGDVTLHAPGQFVVYPILNLKRAGLGLREYLVNLEQVVVAFLGSFGIVANGDNNRRGVWVGRKKIASIGIAVSRWVSYHGIGLNVSTELDLFGLIRPCGLSVQMTSMTECLGRRMVIGDIHETFKDHFLQVFSV